MVYTTSSSSRSYCKKWHSRWMRTFCIVYSSLHNFHPHSKAKPSRMYLILMITILPANDTLLAGMQHYFKRRYKNQNASKSLHCTTFKNFVSSQCDSICPLCEQSILMLRRQGKFHWPFSLSSSLISGYMIVKKRVVLLSAMHLMSSQWLLAMSM